jgi:transcription termination factor Rho
MAAEALEQSALEGKDKDQLLQIAKALGVTGVSKLKKSDLVDKIIEATGGPSEVAPSVPSTNGSGAPKPESTQSATEETASEETPPQRPSRFSRRSAVVADNAMSAISSSAASAVAAADDGNPTLAASKAADAMSAVQYGADGEPLADWELDLAEFGVSTETTPTDAGSARSGGDRDGRHDGGRQNGRESESRDGQRTEGQRNRNGGNNAGGSGRNQNPQSGGGNRNPQSGDGNRSPQSGDGSRNQGGGPQSDRNDADAGNKRRRRRRKGGRGQEGPQGEDLELFDDEGQPQSNEPIDVSGHLDMRDEGYGFLRINGYLPSADDAYIPVKLARQYGLRKGDLLAGKMRPPGRNEKNPALLEVFTVNGGDPEVAKKRPRFEDLTALFPDEQLKLEDPSDPTNMTARIIDLISPIGKGQRGILVSPPKAGKTTIMKTIAKMIEKNNPEVKLIMLLIDERPEEVTDIKRTVKGEVISSTFDRPSDEHTAIAEMTIAKAKRMVEEGKDVVIMLDGITRLSRAYNLAAPASGRILSGGIDAGALYPPKKFFGAARNIEEGGSLTILATALVDTNSRMDEAIFEEFKGTGNMELRLDRKVAERRIYPAIDVDASSTRHEELLFDRRELQMVWKLRRVLSGLAADGNAAPGLELLMDRLKTFKSNSEFLSEIAKQPGM